MELFFTSFLITFGLVLLVLFIISLIAPYFSRLFGAKSVPYKSVIESTEWLNYILSHFLMHFQSEDSITKINDLIAMKIHSNQFHVISLGKAPIIDHVATLEMQEADDIRLLIPIEWESGPSLDIFKSKFLKIEFDLLNFSGQILASWPGNSPNLLEIKFVGDTKIDIHTAIQFLNIIRISITDIPLLGKIIKGFISLYIVKQTFHINLPKPNPKKEMTSNE